MTPDAFGCPARSAQISPEKRSGRDRFSATACLVRVGMDELTCAAGQILMEIKLSALQVNGALGIDDHLDPLYLIYAIVLPDLLVKIDGVAQAGAAAALHSEAQASFGKALYVHQSFDFLDGRL